MTTTINGNFIVKGKLQSISNNLLQTIFLDIPNDLTVTNLVLPGTTSETTFFTFNYTPLSSNSSIVINIDSFVTVGGSGYTGGDAYELQIKNNTTIISSRVLVWVENIAGNDSSLRYNSFFPIEGVYTNTDTTTKTFTLFIKKRTDIEPTTNDYIGLATNTNTSPQSIDNTQMVIRIDEIEN